MITLALEQKQQWPKNAVQWPTNSHEMDKELSKRIFKSWYFSSLYCSPSPWMILSMENIIFKEMDHHGMG